MLVEVVIINWRRPSNVANIVDAFRDQTVPCRITVVDCSKSDIYQLDSHTISKLDAVYTSTMNFGGYNRYVPLASYKCPYTFFVDDDILPGKKCIEAFLEAAARIDDFGVLGQVGRTIKKDNVYRPLDVRRTKDFVETDFVVRAYFVKTRLLYNVVRFKWHIGYFETNLLEDDLLLCSSLNYYEGLSNYLIPFCGDVETLVIKQELPANYSLSSRIDHFKLRTKFIERILLFGWTPMYLRTNQRPNDIIA